MALRHKLENKHTKFMFRVWFHGQVVNSGILANDDEVPPSVIFDT